METHLGKLLLLSIGMAFVLAAASPADAAKARKHKRHTGQAATVVDNSRYRGTNLFPAGPLYNGPDYIGDDPDPFIRLQLMRDLSGHYGGND